MNYNNLSTTDKDRHLVLEQKKRTVGLTEREREELETIEQKSRRVI